MKNDNISRQAAINWLKNEWDGMVTSVFKGIESLPPAQPEKICIAAITMTDEQVREAFEKAKAQVKLLLFPSTQSETCKGCKHLGKWEDEVEYGYPSPCTWCKRRVEDYYEC